MNNPTETKIEALMKHLDISNDDAALLLDNGDYEVLTGSEADKKTKEQILESVWAFRSEFLSNHLKEGIDSDIIDLIQSNEKCEDNNVAILSLIGDVDHLVQDSIYCDGRGPFLSQYDGEENEVTINGTTLYIYRNN